MHRQQPRFAAKPRDHITASLSVAKLSNNATSYTFIMLSLTHNFLFVHIPKTGGNSIQSALHRFSDDNIVKINAIHDGIERFEIKSKRYATHKHSTLEEYRQQYGNPLFSKLYKFSCIRNTYDRLLSFYFSPHRGPIAWDRSAFVKFIRDIPPMSYYLELSDPENGLDPYANFDHLLRFENLTADWAELCEAAGIPKVPLLHLNKSQKMDTKKNTTMKN